MNSKKIKWVQLMFVLMVILVLFAGCKSENTESSIEKNINQEDKEKEVERVENGATSVGEVSTPVQEVATSKEEVATSGEEVATSGEEVSTSKEEVSTSEEEVIENQDINDVVGENGKILINFEQEATVEDFPINEGDDMYFLPLTEDYVFTKRDPNPDDDLEEYEIHLMAFNEMGLVEQYIVKFIKTNEEDAKSTYDNFYHGGYTDANESGYVENSEIRIGNVVYCNYNISGNDSYKDELLRSLLEIAFYFDNPHFEDISGAMSEALRLNQEFNFTTTWFSKPCYLMEEEIYEQYCERF